MSDPIDDYLAQLRQALQVRPRLKTRILWEIEDHLCEAVEQEERRGLAPDAAQRKAIARVGSPEQVAASFAAEAEEYRQQLSRRAFLLAAGQFAEGIRWHLLALVPLGLGIWFLVLAQRVQGVYQKLISWPSGAHAAYAPLLSMPAQIAAQAISDIHALGWLALSCTLLLLLLAGMELLLKPRVGFSSQRSRAAPALAAVWGPGAGGPYSPDRGSIRF